MSDNSNLIKLFREKKYLQIINYIEHEINIEDRNSSILNLLATCRLLKLKPSKQDYENSLNDFRTSYIKEKNTPRAHEALLNFINLTPGLLVIISEPKTPDCPVIPQLNFIYF